MRRSAYPEVSFGVMEGIVAGLMGVRPSASQGVLRTIPQLTSATTWAELTAVPVLGTTIGLRQEGTGKSTFTNSGTTPVKWQACFYGNDGTIRVDDKEMKADFATDEVGDCYSFVTVEVPPQSTLTASTH
jgi:hypothetical protein